MNQPITNQDSTRVVVAAVGAVTALGYGAQTLWQRVREGQVGIRPVKSLPMDGLDTTYGAEVEYRDPEPYRISYLPGAGPEPALDFALEAAAEAIGASGLLGAIEPERWGVVVGTCNGGLVSGERLMRATMAGRRAAWRDALLYPPQAFAEALAAAFDFRGPALSVNTACASGAHAIGHALDLIRGGHADAVLAGGTDALSGIVFAGFNSLESLAPTPAAPYAKHRDGLSLGEGAGMLVLVRADLAARRGTPVLADVLGYGLSADGYHPTAPHPEGRGAARAIGAAMDTAGLTPAEVGYVNGHGTGTPKNDPAEVAAVRSALGRAADTVALSSTKSMIGHLLGAAGAVEGIVTVLALRDGFVPPTANVREADPRCEIDAVPNTGRPKDFDAALSNNFAFGGANACVAYGRPGRRAATRREPAAQRVAVTGIAALSPYGIGVPALVEAYREGVQVPAEPGEDGPRIARVDFDPRDHLPRSVLRRVDHFGALALATARLALLDAGMTLDGAQDPRVGVVLGTGLGPADSMERFALPVLEEGPAAAHPAVFPNTVYSQVAGQVATAFGLTGATSTVTAAHAAGAGALTVARELLRNGRADAVVVLAVDVLPSLVVQAYRSIPLLRSRTADTFTLAEGAYALVLESESTAVRRGARITAELAGYGIANDARGVGRWSADGGGVERAMRIALEHGGARYDELDSVWLSASGLDAADRPEQEAVDRLLAGHACPREEPKRILGEPVGAGACLGTALALWTPSAGPVLVNSSSLGGTHISLLYTPWKG